MSAMRPTRAPEAGAPTPAASRLRRFRITLLLPVAVAAASSRPLSLPFARRGPRREMRRARLERRKVLPERAFLLRGRGRAPGVLLVGADRLHGDHHSPVLMAEEVAVKEIGAGVILKALADD